MKEGKIITTKIYTSPCGDLLLGSFEDKLCLCDWVEAKHHPYILRRLCNNMDAELRNGSTEIIEKAATQLEKYFKGERDSFEIPLLFTGTDFQKKVWHTLLEIPYGATISYGDLSKQIDRPLAMRAVANANGANALSIFVPCHRVVGSNGGLTGYAGGLLAKDFLLNLEKIKIKGEMLELLPFPRTFNFLFHSNKRRIYIE